MAERTETVLHWAAATSVVVLGLLAFLPETLRARQLVGPPVNYLIGAILGVTLVGFHFRMLFECARGGRWTVGRIGWLIFLLLLPVASAIVYFIFTRSRTFDSGMSAPATQR
jgi:hypothetical protein